MGYHMGKTISRMVWPLAVKTQYRHVTHVQTDRRPDILRQKDHAYATHSVAWVKTYRYTNLSSSSSSSSSKGNRRSGVARAMRQTTVVLPPTGSRS